MQGHVFGGRDDFKRDQGQGRDRFRSPRRQSNYMRKTAACCHKALQNALPDMFFG